MLKKYFSSITLQDLIEISKKKNRQAKKKPAARAH